MNINITHYHFEEIIRAGYTLDMIYFLKLAEEGIDVQSICTDPKMQMLCQSVRRKGLLSESFKVTLIGKSVIGFLDEEGTPETKLVKKKQDSNDFDDWWKTYPGTDTFTHKKQDFTGTRSMRVKKDDCKVKLNSILAEGEYTIKEMIAALEYEVMQKKENSYKTKTNKLSYMQNSLTYLNQRTFEPFIELVREGKKIVEAPIITGGTDI
jgi:hypothetical protein